MRLWDYAVAVYSIDGVKDRLLTLQDRHGGDINITLWCLWCGHQGLAPTAQDLGAILPAADTITHRAVRPLREVRRYLSAPEPSQDRETFVSLRSEVLALELAAEKLVLEQLERSSIEQLPRTSSPSDQDTNCQSLFTLALKHMDIDLAINDEGDPESPKRLFESILMLAKDHGP